MSHSHPAVWAPAGTDSPPPPELTVAVLVEEDEEAQEEDGGARSPVARISSVRRSADLFPSASVTGYALRTRSTTAYDSHSPLHQTSPTSRKRRWRKRKDGPDDTTIDADASKFPRRSLRATMYRIAPAPSRHTLTPTFTIDDDLRDGAAECAALQRRGRMRAALRGSPSCSDTQAVPSPLPLAEEYEVADEVVTVLEYNAKAEAVEARVEWGAEIWVARCACTCGVDVTDEKRGITSAQAGGTTYDVAATAARRLLPDALATSRSLRVIRHPRQGRCSTPWQCAPRGAKPETSTPRERIGVEFEPHPHPLTALPPLRFRLARVLLLCSHPSPLPSPVSVPAVGLLLRNEEKGKGGSVFVRDNETKERRKNGGTTRKQRPRQRRGKIDTATCTATRGATNEVYQVKVANRRVKSARARPCVEESKPFEHPEGSRITSLTRLQEMRKLYCGKTDSAADAPHTSPTPRTSHLEDVRPSSLRQHAARKVYCSLHVRLRETQENVHSRVFTPHQKIGLRRADLDERDGNCGRGGAELISGGVAGHRRKSRSSSSTRNFSDAQGKCVEKKTAAAPENRAGCTETESAPTLTTHDIRNAEGNTAASANGHLPRNAAYIHVSEEYAAPPQARVAQDEGGRTPKEHSCTRRPVHEEFPDDAAPTPTQAGSKGPRAPRTVHRPTLAPHAGRRPHPPRSRVFPNCNQRHVPNVGGRRISKMEWRAR
ncbi:hypothetical protein B0H16DRAFT_1695659 [Mycena metata]|uniref:Uncharacterized protein n=1 Tax=Mycena metata TaxID=1033252 RepID=A0AAD7I719_9AGAR|nr:hypothetical protein B0H16DRAFT_1695659 [Mycena metata]